MSEQPALNETALKSLQDRAKDPTLVPGSDEEKALRNELLALREQTKGEFATVHSNELAAVATPEGIVHASAARHAGHTALEKVTSGEMAIPTHGELELEEARQATELVSEMPIPTEADLQATSAAMTAEAQDLSRLH